MFRKSFISVLMFAAVLCAASATASAQYATASGTVKSAAGEGVAGALVEVYNDNGKIARSSTKTDKKGYFSFVGVPYGEKFILAVSAAGFTPKLQPNVKAAMENIAITLAEGDGHKLTEAEVKQALDTSKSTVTKVDSTDAPGELTADQKAQKAKEDAAISAVESKNAKTLKTNEIINAAIKAGVEAFQAKNYDLAIQKFTEGYDASPDYVGSAPILLNNRGVALSNRAVDNYNKNAKNPDVQAKIAANDGVKKDLLDSITSYKRAYELYGTVKPEDGIDPKTVAAGKLKAINGARDTIVDSIKTKQVDPAITEPAAELAAEYEKLQTEPAKKDEAMLLMPDLYLAAGTMDEAIAGYRKVLAVKPDSIDALVGLGLSLVNKGFMDDNKAMLQEGADNLAKFAAAAPDTHRYKKDAVDMLAALKEQQIAPAKTGKKKN